MSKSFFKVVILGLSGFYLYVLYLAAHPNVSLAYRLYYMEEKTRFWEYNSTMNYPIGEVLDLTKPSRFLSRKGWSKKLTAEGTTLNGEGRLYFVLPKREDNIANVTLYARIYAAKEGNMLTVKMDEEKAKAVRPLNAGLNEVMITLPAAKQASEPTQLTVLVLSSLEPINVQSLSLTMNQ